MLGRRFKSLLFAFSTVIMAYLSAFIGPLLEEFDTGMFQYGIAKQFYLLYASWWGWLQRIIFEGVSFGSFLQDFLALALPVLMTVAILTILTYWRKKIPLSDGRLKSGLLALLSIIPYYFIGILVIGSPYDFRLPKVILVWIPNIVFWCFLWGSLYHDLFPSVD